MKLKTWLYIILGVLLLAGVVYGFFYFKNLREDNADLRLALAKKDSIITINETTVLKLGNQIDLQRVNFGKEMNKLAKQLQQEYNQRLAVYIDIAAQYNAFRDSVQTFDDAVFVFGDDGDSTLVETRRKFATWITPNELYVEGSFQKQEPYLISFTDVSLSLNPQVILSRSEDDESLWAVTVNGNSSFLKADNIEVLVDDDVQLKDRWKFFLGAGYGNAFNTVGGIGYYDYSIYGSASFKNEALWSIGIMKEW